MKIQLLGTGTSQGVPIIGCRCPVCQSEDPKDKRLRSAVLIESTDTSIVIDSGPDFRQQMLNANVRDLDAILLTHAHRDHIAGLDDSRAFIFRSGKAFDIYAEDNVVKELKQIFAYAFSGNLYPGTPRFNVHTISLEPFSIGDMTIQPIRGYHYQLPVMGFRIEDFVYVTDVNHIPEEEKKKMMNAKVLVLDALRIKEHISHYNLGQALELVKELNPEKTFFTHISHEMGFHKEVSRQLPDTVNLGHDQLTINL